MKFPQFIKWFAQLPCIAEKAKFKKEYGLLKLFQKEYLLRFSLQIQSNNPRSNKRWSLVDCVPFSFLRLLTARRLHSSIRKNLSVRRKLLAAMQSGARGLRPPHWESAPKNKILSPGIFLPSNIFFYFYKLELLIKLTYQFSIYNFQPLDFWDVSNVEDMECMFEDARSLYSCVVL